ncbi:MAG: hypothetical protein WCP59_04490, partial [Actinomycetota bacterium]
AVVGAASVVGAAVVGAAVSSLPHAARSVAASSAPAIEVERVVRRVAGMARSMRGRHVWMPSNQV